VLGQDRSQNRSTVLGKLRCQIDRIEITSGIVLDPLKNSGIAVSALDKSESPYTSDAADGRLGQSKQRGEENADEDG